MPLPGVRHIPLQLLRPAGTQEPPQLVPQPLGRRAPACGPGGDRVLQRGRGSGARRPPPHAGLRARQRDPPGSAPVHRASPGSGRAGRASPPARAGPRGRLESAAVGTARPRAAPLPGAPCEAKHGQAPHSPALPCRSSTGLTFPLVPTAPHLRRWANLGSVASAGTRMGTGMGTSVVSILPSLRRCQARQGLCLGAGARKGIPEAAGLPGGRLSVPGEPRGRSSPVQGVPALPPRSHRCRVSRRSAFSVRRCHACCERRRKRKRLDGWRADRKRRGRRDGGAVGAGPRCGSVPALRVR